MIHTNKVFTRTLIASVSAILVACGGSSGSSSPAATTTPANVISGTAAKGLLTNAVVTAYCGAKTPSSVAIGSTKTSATDGTYSLTLTSACALPVEVVVTPSTTGTPTAMLDEVTGAPVSVPTNFALRAFAPSGSGTISLPVTPFTDMAAAVVEQTVTNGTTISTGVVTNANTAIIQNVLGGNGAIFTATPLPPSSYATATPEQQQLITLLSGISQYASTLNTGTPGGNVQQALTNLANQAKATVTAVSSSGFTISPTVNSNATTGNTPLATINAGLVGLASSTSLPASFPAAIQSTATTLQTTVVQTASTQVATNQSTNGGVVAAPTTDGVTAAKTLLTGIKTNLQTFGNPQQTGFLQTKSTALTNDATTYAGKGVYNFVDIVKGSQRATALLVETNRAVATSTAVVNAASGSDAFGSFYQRIISDGPGDQWNCKAYYSLAGASTVTDPVSGATRTSPYADNGNKPMVTCNYYPTHDGVTMIQFIVKSPAAPAAVTSGASLPYVNRIRTWALSNCTSAANGCQYTDTNQVSSTSALTAVWDSNAVVSAVTMTAAPVTPYIGTTTTTMDLAYTATKVGFVSTLNFSGALTSGALKYNFLNGSTATITDTSNGAGTSGTVSVNLLGRISTAAFQYDGTFTVSGASATPDQGSFSLAGSISTLSNGTATKFLEGTLIGDGTANTMSFTGKATNGTNVTSIAMDGTKDIANAKQTASITFLTGAYSFTATGTNYDNPATASTMDVIASDQSKVSVSRQNGISTVVVKNAAGNTIGTMSGNQVNFNDNTYIVLN